MTPAQAAIRQPQVDDPAPRTQFGEPVLPERSLKGLAVAARVDHDRMTPEGHHPVQLRGERVVRFAWERQALEGARRRPAPGLAS